MRNGHPAQGHGTQALLFSLRLLCNGNGTFLAQIFGSTKCSRLTESRLRAGGILQPSGFSRAKGGSHPAPSGSAVR